MSVYEKQTFLEHSLKVGEWSLERKNENYYYLCTICLLCQTTTYLFNTTCK